jgi:hypothetical protein
MGYSIRDDKYRYTQWVDFRNGEVLAEEFYDYAGNIPELNNQMNDSRHIRVIEKLKRRLEELIGDRNKTKKHR